MQVSVLTNVALAIRVMILGGFLLILPHITRKGLLFGNYIGEAQAEASVGSRLIGRWYIGCLLVMVAPLLIGYGISLAGRPVAGNLIGTAILVVGAFALYLRFHFWARKLVPAVAAEAPVRASASLESPGPQGARLAKLALGICIVIASGAFAYTVFRLGDMNVKSVAAVLFVPSVNIVASPFLALYAVLAAGAKRSIRDGSGGRSVEAQNAFRSSITRLLSWYALLCCAFLAWLSIQIVRKEVSEADSLGTGVWVFGAVAMVWVLVNMVSVMARHGQGGALRERGSVEAPLTNGIADNARWVWGVFYVDREDPSIMVESRFGFGYTFNYGNRTAVFILVGFGVELLALTALTVFAVVTGGA